MKPLIIPHGFFHDVFHGDVVRFCLHYFAVGKFVPAEPTVGVSIENKVVLSVFTVMGVFDYGAPTDRHFLRVPPQSVDFPSPIQIWDRQAAKQKDTPEACLFVWYG